jgi:molybdopterin converting factor subunit 1
VRVNVQLFALARERAGRSSVFVDLPEPATVAALRQALIEAVPALAPLLPVMRIAVNSEYASDEQGIEEGADLAAIPPVSGG